MTLATLAQIGSTRQLGNNKDDFKGTHAIEHTKWTLTILKQ